MSESTRGFWAGLFLFLSTIASAMDDTVRQKTIEVLVNRCGESQRERIVRGVTQAAALWREADGDAQAFHRFCLEHFIADPAELSQALQRLEDNLETIGGHTVEVARDLARPLQLEIGPILAMDYLFAEYDPSAHVSEDLFKTKIAFVALLNFPNTTLTERLQQGPHWSRLQWAAARLVQRFNERVPAPVHQALTRAYVQADDYISHYNLYMHQLVDGKGRRLFPQDLKLISHWGLRDELKAQYAAAEGLARQRLIQSVMERIIAQQIPQEVIDQDQATWNPLQNRLVPERPFEPEPDARYQRLLDVFHAEQGADPYYPQLPSKISRRFERDREIPEAQFKRLLVSVLTDPVGRDVSRLIAKRLGRKLEPFDIWYNGFRPVSGYDETELDRRVMARYPHTAAFQADLPRILMQLGFAAETAEFLSGKITVDPSRGAGHAMGAGRRDDNAHLRTRIPSDGMRYKGYNIAIHELGHCVEQVFSLNRIDHTLLAGVPNTAFTEAFAFVFQSRDLELLGLDQRDALAEPYRALDTFWSTCEIAAVGLVDMEIWHWMYDHPQATAAEVKAAMLRISREIWNTYIAPLINVTDSPLLAIYSHLIDAGLYLPDYSLGHIIMFQIEQYLHDRNLGQEMERMCKLGALTPDVWMQSAVGGPLSAEPLLQATRAAIRTLNSSQSGTKP
ncbi:MAG TPA: hypothetical protein PK843_04480 [bacterium]|nr:hypothetical protein [bacterium]